MSAILIAACLGLTFIASRTTYWILKVFAGFLWWALAFYWVQLPASTNQALQTILIMVTIFIGLAVMFWDFWASAGKDKFGNEKGHFRIPFMHNDDEEDEGRNAPTYKERNMYYRQRLNDAVRGIRRR